MTEGGSAFVLTNLQCCAVLPRKDSGGARACSLPPGALLAWVGGARHPNQSPRSVRAFAECAEAVVPRPDFYAGGAQCHEERVIGCAGGPVAEGLGGPEDQVDGFL